MPRECTEWASVDELTPLPSDQFLTAYMALLTSSALVAALVLKTVFAGDRHNMLQRAGVAVNKVAKTAWEIDRKLFKLVGLGVPMLHQIFLKCGFNNNFCIAVCWILTLSWVSCDILRIYVPFVRRLLDLVFKEILRKDEQDQLSGASYFLIGAALTVHLFAPAIAMTSIILLVIGVLCAHIIARSFGKAVVNIECGKHKSIEGSVAMFVVCFALGCTIFHQVYLREYAVVVAALTATLVEFYEPLGINYNVSIPVLTSVALTMGFARTFSCARFNPLFWFETLQRAVTA